MSESKQLKFIYESTVQKQYDDKSIEKKSDGTEISTPVKKLKPVKIAILKANRRLHELSEIFYAKTMANFIREGLMPFSLVQKRYSNDGGALSEPEKVILINLRNEITESEGKFFELSDIKTEIKDEKLEKEKRDLLLKINDLNQQVNNIQTSYADIYENTAEVKARNKLVEWWILNLSYIDEDNKGYKCLFGEGNLEDKFNKYDDLIEQSDLFYNDLLNRFAYLVSFWFSSKTNLTKENFENAEKLYQEKLSNYLPEETKSPEIVVTQPVTTPVLNG